MRPFDYARADDPAGAVAAVAERPDATYLAGGTNLVDHLKLGITAPDLLVDLGRLDLADIEELPDGGLRVGAMVRNSDLAADPRVRRLASVACALSMLSFLLLYWLAGAPPA